MVGARGFVTATVLVGWLVVVVIALGLIAMRLELFDDPVLLPLFVERDGLAFCFNIVNTQRDERKQMRKSERNSEILKRNFSSRVWIGSKTNGKWNAKWEQKGKNVESKPTQINKQFTEKSLLGS